MEAALHVLTEFLQQETRSDLKELALRNISGLTSNANGLEAIIKNVDLLKVLVLHLNEQSGADCLINVSASEVGARELLKGPNVVQECLRGVVNPESVNADRFCMILSNLTRTPENVDKVFDFIENSLDDLIGIFTKNHYNKNGANLHYLASFLANLSQNYRFRKFLLDTETCVIQRLLPFVNYEGSIVRRKGIVATIKNCCFETEHHEWLLNDNVDILPNLLLPLTDNTEFSEEENEKLPLDLQYLPENKQRESDAEIR